MAEQMQLDYRISVLVSIFCICCCFNIILRQQLVKICEMQDIKDYFNERRKIEHFGSTGSNSVLCVYFKCEVHVYHEIATQAAKHQVSKGASIFCKYIVSGIKHSLE